MCAVVSAEFLALQRELGNDLTSPRPEYGFPGLKPGDRWCVVAVRWLQAYQAGAAAGVVLAATNARALEVVRSTGLPLAYWQQANGSGIDNEVTLHPVILRPPLSTLRERTEARFTRMLDEGAVEEVRTLLDRGLSPDLPVMRAIGVPEIAGWLGGVWSREEAELRGQRSTWQYVRRQFTWLRAQPPPHWPRTEEEPFDEEVSFASLLR